MVEPGWTWLYEQRITSDSASGRKVVELLLKQLEEASWDDHDVFGIHLAVEEALVNAIKHGNQKDETKRVDVVYRMGEDRIRIEITDEGQGFDPNKVPDPTNEENLEIPSGRGLMLMRSYMTTVEFNEAGNQVIMEKTRSRCAKSS